MRKSGKYLVQHIPFAPFVRELTCPIVLIALQPDARLDYEHATIYKQLYNEIGRAHV